MAFLARFCGRESPDESAAEPGTGELRPRTTPECEDLDAFGRELEPVDIVVDDEGVSWSGIETEKSRRRERSNGRDGLTSISVIQ